jgi:hypothetical protein
MRTERSSTGSRAAVMRRNEGTRLSSLSDDEVGGDKARSARSERSERSNLYGFGPSFHSKNWAGSVKQHSLGIVAQ